MRLNSKEAEENALYRGMYRTQQFANVVNASKRLQNVMGIPPGARMMGNKTVRIWELPQKPKTWMQMIQEMHGSVNKGQPASEAQVSQRTVPTIAVQSAQEVEDQLRSRRQQDKAGNTPRRPLTRDMRKMPESVSKPPAHRHDFGLPHTNVNGVEGEHKRKLIESPSLQPSPRIDALPQGQIPRPSQLEQSTTGTERLQHGLSAVKAPPTARPAPSKVSNASLFPQIPASAQPASPPFHFAVLQDSAKQEKLPLYWDWLLSKRVNEWLEDETTASTQTELTHVELRSADGSMLPLRYEAKDFEKVKLTRMTISPTAETERSRNPAITGAPEQRDWFIFEVQSKNVVIASLEMDEDGMPIGEPDRDPDDFPEDYWLLAIPVCAVTDTRSTSMALHGGQVLQTTAWAVGQEDFVPSMHGRGLKETFAEGFMSACASRKGVVEFASVYEAV